MLLIIWIIYLFVFCFLYFWLDLHRSLQCWTSNNKKNHFSISDNNVTLYLSVTQWAHQKFGKSKLFICLLVRFSTLFQKAALCDVTNGSGMSMMPLMGCRQALVYWSPERSAFSMLVSLSIPTAPRSISWRNRQALSCWLRILKSQTKKIHFSSLFLVFSNLGFIHINELVISLKIQSEVSKRIDIKKGSNHPESIGSAPVL